MDIQKNIYNSRMKNLMGIFGMLLLFHFISWSLYFVAIIYTIVLSWEQTPSQLVASSFVLFLFNNISNPIIQIFFRSDLRESLQAILCLCGRKRQKNRSLSISSRPECWSRELPALVLSENLVFCGTKIMIINLKLLDYIQIHHQQGIVKYVLMGLRTLLRW